MKRTVFKYLYAILIGLGAIACQLLPVGSVLGAAALCCALICFGPRAGIVGCAVAGAGILAIGGLGSLPSLFSMLLPAFALYYASGVNDYFRAASIASSGMLAGAACFFGGELLINHINWIEQTYAITLDILEATKAQTGQLAQLSEAFSADAYAGMFDAFSETVTNIYLSAIPSIFVLFSAIFGVLALAACRGICKKRLMLRQPFALYSVPRTFALATVLMLLVSYSMQASNGHWEGAYLAVQTLCMCAFYLQGVALAAFIFHVKNYSTAVRKVLVAVIIIFSVLMPIISSMLLITGVMETIFRFRDRIAKSGIPRKT